MRNPLIDVAEQIRLGAQALMEFGSHLFNPTIRLGVTGMSGAGKTVFITALIHGLVRGGRFPVFEALSSGRISSARLSPQPDDAVPRFDYESHIDDIVNKRRWPNSTRHVSELRLQIDYQSRRGAMRTLTLDIVDYPGEWLLDLPLLNKSYAEWSAESIATSRQHPQAGLASEWHRFMHTLHSGAPENEQAALTEARLFTDYLRACRDQRFAMSMLPPGRFLMPGDLAGSPALTFAPLEVPLNELPPIGSQWAMMERRYEAYKSVVVRPFFLEHFARLDHQVVLVDVLSAFNAGPQSLHDLESALTSVLACFKAGRWNLLNALFSPRIDRILFAATKADHVHQESHDRLENILRKMTAHAAERAQFAGAKIDVIALAAVRATREAAVKQGKQELPAIIGTPAAGETMGQRKFDGETEAAMFPGELPADVEDVFAKSGAFRGLTDVDAAHADFRFLRLLPPRLPRDNGEVPELPNIRLDRALQFLLGDRLQ